MSGLHDLRVNIAEKDQMKKILKNEQIALVFEKEKISSYRSRTEGRKAVEMLMKNEEIKWVFGI